MRRKLTVLLLAAAMMWMAVPAQASSPYGHACISHNIQADSAGSVWGHRSECQLLFPGWVNRVYRYKKICKGAACTWNYVPPVLTTSG